MSPDSSCILVLLQPTKLSLPCLNLNPFGTKSTDYLCKSKTALIHHVNNKCLGWLTALRCKKEPPQEQAPGRSCSHGEEPTGSRGREGPWRRELYPLFSSVLRLRIRISW